MPAPAHLQWTDERVAVLKELWADENLSASQIGALLDGLTSNAVIGKARRLKLPSREKIRHKLSVAGKARSNVSQEKKPQIIPQPISTHDPLNVKIDALTTKHCRYPYGTQAPYTFCGHPVFKSGESWCEFHRRVVFSKGATPEDVAKAIAARDASLLRKSGLV